MKPLVMITGAGNRIGAATARAFSHAGHPLLLLAHRFDNLAALELPQALCISADLLDHAAVDAAIVRGEAAYGPVDCLINNTAAPAPGEPRVPATSPTSGHSGHAGQWGDTAWHASPDRHHEGAENCMHALIPAMKARRRGTIVNIRPVAGRRAQASPAAPGPAPRYLHGLSDAARCSLAEHDVRVVVVSPSLADGEPAGDPPAGETLTGLSVPAGLPVPPGRRAAWAGDHALEAGIAAEHVARTVLFAYQMPQDVVVQELNITPTRQSY